MSRTTVLVVITFVALGLGAGFASAWATAPRTVIRPTLEEIQEVARVEEDGTVRDALDSWIYESSKANGLRLTTMELRAATREENPEGGPYFLIDVRAHIDWLDRHIPGAVNIPLNQLTALSDRLPADRATPIVTYCGDGNRGALAVAALRTLGYSNVRTLWGGFSAWMADGYPVTAYEY